MPEQRDKKLPDFRVVKRLPPDYINKMPKRILIVAKDLLSPHPDFFFVRHDDGFFLEETVLLVPMV
jgi:hypothetical protein